MLERLFHLNENRTTVRTELVAGVTTFLAMAYIIFVQPAVLGAAGMDSGAVLVATCLAARFATLLMGLLANYPIAVAPAMGHNFFFAFTVLRREKVPWRVALGAVAIAGAVHPDGGLRAARAVDRRDPGSLKHAIGVGIGLLVALIGLQWGRAHRRFAGHAGDPRESDVAARDPDARTLLIGRPDRARR